MYNVRFYKYPSGYQFRVYSNVFCDDEYVKVDENNVVDVDTGEVLPRYLVFNVADDKSVEEELEKDEWYSVDSEITFEDLPDNGLEEKEKKHADSVRHSIARTRNNLYYLARSNIWDWFVTLTISPEKMDRYDFAECSKRVRKWLNNLKVRKAPGLYYLFVPELHEDGAWHFHGLMGGCSGVPFIDSGHFTEKGQQVFNIDSYNYGWSYCVAIGGTIEDSARCSNYICKYVTKDLCETVPGRQRYWSSKKLTRAEVFEAYLNPVQMKKFRERLMDNMTWKKKHLTEFVDVEYFELPPDDSILE